MGRGGEKLERKTERGDGWDGAGGHTLQENITIISKLQNRKFPETRLEWNIRY